MAMGPHSSATAVSRAAMEGKPMMEVAIGVDSPRRVMNLQ